MREFWHKEPSEYSPHNLVLIDLYLTNLQKNLEILESINDNLIKGKIDEVLSQAESWWVFHMELIGDSLTIEEGMGQQTMLESLLFVTAVQLAAKDWELISQESLWSSIISIGHAIK
jgi:hypothetical protein